MIRLTFKDLPRLIDLVPHLVHICVAKVAVRRVADLHAASSRQKVIGAT